MKQFKFKTSATEGSIHNPSEWDYMPEDASAAYQEAKDEISKQMKAIPDSVSDEEWEKKYRSLRSELIQVNVTNEGDHFRTGATEQVNTGDVELIINL